MFGWVDFFLCLFWIILAGFVLNVSNFISLMLYAELTWLVLYGLSILVGAQIDDITTTSMTFFILGFGGLEFAIGLMIVVMTKNFNISDKLNFNPTPINTTKTWNF